MNIRKGMKGFAIFVLAFIGLVLNNKEIKAWNSGTIYGFSNAFNYQVTSGWNLTTSGGQNPVTHDEAKEAGGGFRKLSNGTVYVSKDIIASIKITNAEYSMNPIDEVKVEDEKLALLVKHTSGDLKQFYLEYSILGKEYGSTNVIVKRSNGDTFKIPVIIIKRASIESDEGKLEKNITMGVGQTVSAIPDPIIKYGTNSFENLLKSVNCIPFENEIEGFDWSSDNSAVVQVNNNGEMSALKEGTAIVTCHIYDTLACTNREHYNDVIADQIVKFYVKVKKSKPVIELYEGNKKLDWLLEKRVGDKFVLDPRIDDGMSTFKWLFCSTDEDVVKVDNNGKVEVLKKGNCLINVKALGQTYSLCFTALDKNREYTFEEEIAKPKIKSIKKKHKKYVLKIKGKKYTGFEIFYGTNKKAKKRLGLTKTKTYKIKAKLKKNKKYYFKVRGYRRSGSSIAKSPFSKVYKLKVK